MISFVNRVFAIVLNEGAVRHSEKSKKSKLKKVKMGFYFSPRRGDAGGAKYLKLGNTVFPLLSFNYASVYIYTNNLKNYS
jgi:hypothetical protein